MNYQNKHLYVFKRGWSWRSKQVVDNRFEFLYGPLFVPDVAYYLKEKAGIINPIAIKFGDVITAKSSALSTENIEVAKILEFLDNPEFDPKVGICKVYLEFEAITERKSSKLFCNSQLFKTDENKDVVFSDNAIISAVRIKPKQYFSYVMKNRELLYEKELSTLIGGKTKQEMHDFLTAGALLGSLKHRTERAVSKEVVEEYKNLIEKIESWGYGAKENSRLQYMNFRTLFSLVLYLGMLVKNGIR